MCVGFVGRRALYDYTRFVYFTYIEIFTRDGPRLGSDRTKNRIAFESAHGSVQHAHRLPLFSLPTPLCLGSRINPPLVQQSIFLLFLLLYAIVNAAGRVSARA